MGLSDCISSSRGFKDQQMRCSVRLTRVVYLLVSIPMGLAKPSSKLNTPDRILAAASTLFYRHSFRSVPVDTIAQHAGLTKMTVYQHFGSKEEILIASLRLRLQKREDALDVRLALLDPTDALLGIFDWLAERVVEADFYGCAFVKATNELAADIPRVRSIARECKEAMQKRLNALAEAAGLMNTEEVAEELAVLFEGAQVLSVVQGTAHPVAIARRAALGVIARAKEVQTN
jgi:AcrR family transcriptional regulator